MVNFFEINELIEWVVGAIVFEFIFAIIDIISFCYLFNVKSTKKLKVISIIVDGIFRTLFIVFVPTPIHRGLNLIISVVIFKLFYKQHIEKCILGEVINAMSIVTAECIFSKLFCVLMQSVSTYAEGIYNVVYNVSLMASISCVRSIVLAIVIKKKIIVNIKENLNKDNFNSIMLVAIVGGIIIYGNAIEMTYYITDYPYFNFVLDIISLLLYFYISMKNIMRASTMEEQEEVINTLENYNKTLSIMYDSIRGFRHDFSNFIQALDGYAKTNDVDGMKNMIGSIMQECMDVNNMAILDPEIINNSAVYSIITNKYYLAKENGITMRIEVMTDLNSIKDYSYEFCRILGILLDNSIEAAMDTKEKIINIRIMKDFKVNRKLFIVENSYDKSKNISLEKLFDKGYTTKVDTENMHGLGLWTVKRILRKNEKLDLFTKKEDLFFQQLEIYED